MLQQFDVLANPVAEARKFAPYVVVLQCLAQRSLRTMLIAPLNRETEPAPEALDMPVVFAGEPLNLSICDMGCISRGLLSERLGSLDDHGYDIHRVLDRLFPGC
jgi:hypothetical protein